LLSGSDNHQAGLGNMAEFMAPNQKGKVGYEGHLSDRIVPIPMLLKNAGYNTYMAGKWHMGEEPQHFPAARGFMRDLTLIPGGGSHLEDMWGPKGERQLYTYNGKPIEALRPGFHSSEDYTASIIANIEENRRDGKPFFAYLALQAPHDPFQLPDGWRDRYAGRYDAGYDALRASDEATRHPRFVCDSLSTASHDSGLVRSLRRRAAPIGTPDGTLCRHG
jgi:arylsulfatase A-like enzyme